MPAIGEKSTEARAASLPRSRDGLGQGTDADSLDFALDPPHVAGLHLLGAVADAEVENRNPGGRAPQRGQGGRAS